MILKVHKKVHKFEYICLNQETHFKENKASILFITIKIICYTILLKLSFRPKNVTTF